MLNRLLDALRNVLTGEPLRMISYGSVVVVWFASRVLVYFGILDASVTIDEALVAVTAVLAMITEFARHFVYSPNSVDAIRAGAEFGGGPSA